MKSSDAHEKNCNILSAKKFIFIDCFAVKVDGYDVNQESIYMKTSAQIPGLTSLPLILTAKKSSKIKFSADKILQFFS